MKALIKKSIALTAIFLSSVLFTINKLVADEINNIKPGSVPIKKIIVKGNVELILIQKKYDEIIYANDNIGKAKIIRNGDAIRINSEDKEVTKLIMYVNDIYRIDASDNASVKTEGKLKTKYLQIFLKGNAKAEINTSSESLYTVIKDHSDLKLSGSTDKHILVMGKTPKLTIDKFAALKSSVSSVESISIEKELAAIK